VCVVYSVCVQCVCVAVLLQCCCSVVYSVCVQCVCVAASWRSQRRCPNLSRNWCVAVLLHCLEVCCVLHCVAVLNARLVCCSVVASVLQLCCRALQCIACSVLQCFGSVFYSDSTRAMYKFSKVIFTFISHGTCSSELTFANLCTGRGVFASGMSGRRAGKISEKSVGYSLCVFDWVASRLLRISLFLHLACLHAG